MTCDPPKQSRGETSLVYVKIGSSPDICANWAHELLNKSQVKLKISKFVNEIFKIRKTKAATVFPQTLIFPKISILPICSQFIILEINIKILDFHSMMPFFPKHLLPLKKNMILGPIFHGL